MLNLTHLKVLEAVARHGSVTEAAKELHYSQPSVSHHLGRLEAATGAKLIQRVGRGIRLTPEGELLARTGDRDPGASWTPHPSSWPPAWGFVPDGYDSPVSKRSSAPSCRRRPPSCPGRTRESS